MKVKLAHTYEDVVSLNNLFLAWQEFAIGKRGKRDVQEFSFDLSGNIISLHEDLVNMSYQHGGYESFYINDPKRRHIHKAGVRDRLLHHAVYRKLYLYFDKRFIYDSYSCRIGKGVHKAIERLNTFSRKVSQNNTRQCWILKCDIRKFFDSIDHEILLNILNKHISDPKLLWLLQNIIESYGSVQRHGAGLPLGNLTSQLFGNVYMNVFDQWVKHKLKAKYYIRYADDFIFLSYDKRKLNSMIQPIYDFLYEKLHFKLHSDKVLLQSLSSGVDFLGWVHFPYYRAIRRKTRDRMFRKLVNRPEEAVFQSYLGLLSHGNTYKTEQDLRNLYWLLNSE